MLVITVCAAVTLLATALNLYVAYDEELDAIATSVGDIEQAQSWALMNGISTGNQATIDETLATVVATPGIEQARIIAETGETWTVGTPKAKRLITYEVPLVKTIYAEPEKLGVLIVSASLDNVVARLREIGVRTLSDFALIAVLLGGCVIVVFYRLAGRHLATVAAITRDYDPTRSAATLNIKRSRWLASSDDEIDQVSNFVSRLMTINDDHVKEMEEVNQEIVEQWEQLGANKEEMARHAEALERSNTELERFAYVASHDLQEPLRQITTFIELIKKDMADRLSDDDKHHMEFVTGGAARMRDLIEGILEFSRVGNVVEQTTIVDLKAVFEQIASGFSAELDEIGGAIAVGKLPAIEGDERQLYRMFVNLIGNAIKYRSANRPLEIKVDCEIIENPTDATRTANVYVKDNGIGFDSKHAKQIMEPFKRLHGKAEYDGVGIGLAVCKKIAEQHGAKLIAEGEAGVGACFRLELANAPNARDLH